jgi:hypothetical protein
MIGSVDSFERKLDDAQKELGLSSTSYVPVKYSSEVRRALGSGWVQRGLAWVSVGCWLTLRDAQKELGLSSTSYVPAKYSSEVRSMQGT